MANRFFQVQQISTGVKKIIGAVQEGMFLIEGDKCALLFDTGIGCGDLRGLIRSLTDLPLEYVIVSHAHSDHIGGIGGFSEIWLHEADLPIVSKNKSVEERYGVLKAIEKQHGKSYDFDINDFLKVESYKIKNLYEGQIFDLGRRVLEVVEVPGHTRGSIALLDRENEIMFSGDAFNQSTFIWGEEGLLLSEYRDMLKTHLEKWGGTYRYLYGAHDTCPDPASLVEDVLEAAQGVLGGIYSGVPYAFGERTDLFLAKPPREGGNIGCADGRLGNLVFSRERL